MAAFKIVIYVFSSQGAIAAFAPDETRNYTDEGIGSVAGSLQSLDTEADDKDWKETLQVGSF